MKKNFFENISVTVTQTREAPSLLALQVTDGFSNICHPSQKEAHCRQKPFSPYVHTLWVHEWGRHRRAAGTVPAKREHSTKGR